MTFYDQVAIKTNLSGINPFGLMIGRSLDVWIAGIRCGNMNQWHACCLQNIGGVESDN